MNGSAITPAALLMTKIVNGARVSIRVPAGQKIGQEGKIEQEWHVSTGRAVMRSSQTGGWVLNMGGRYGTPGVATAQNLVAVNGRSVEQFTKKRQV